MAKLCGTGLGFVKSKVTFPAFADSVFWTNASWPVGFALTATFAPPAGAGADVCPPVVVGGGGGASPVGAVAGWFRLPGDAPGVCGLTPSGAVTDGGSAFSG